ncbi:MAG: molybdopterin molybdenumtransferase MoeA, partial [Collinsella sp.]|nr:molybdopterin molybdenumtransferase MoeA [Collinsella sp.]
MAEKLIPLNDAQSIILSHVAPTDLVEIPVWQAAGLPLAEDAVADIDISPFANSAMDGYAVRSADLAQASGEAPVTLDVIGHEAAGHVFEGTIGAGEAVRIMTGAPVPEGADAVVKYEIVEVLDGDGNGGSHVRFSAPAKVGENVRSAAEEAHAGDVVMRAGEVVA